MSSVDSCADVLVSSMSWPEAGGAPCSGSSVEGAMELMVVVSDSRSRGIYGDCGRNWLGLSGRNVMIKVGIVKRNAKRNGNATHESGQEVAKPTKPPCHFAWLGHRSCVETTPGQLQGNYLMQHDETTASPNDSQRESSGKTDKVFSGSCSVAAIQRAPLLMAC